MEEENFKILIKKIEDYFQSQKRLTKLQAVEKVSIATSEIASKLIIFMIILMMFLFMNLAIAYMIALYTGKLYIGFLTVCLIYLFTALLLYFKREAWLKVPISNSIINKFLNND
jgi:hypothetical protein